MSSYQTGSYNAVFRISFGPLLSVAVVDHRGDSIDTTCAVVRDVTAYIAVVRVFRFPSEYYGCRYTNSTHVKAARDCI